MKKLILVSSILAITLMAGCGGGSAGGGKQIGPNQMTITANPDKGEFKVELGGVCEVTIDWGDGSEKVVAAINKPKSRVFNSETFEHKYAEAKEYTIRIAGENITGMRLYDKGVTGLDISKNVALQLLETKYNPITVLDVSKNVALTVLKCDIGCKLTTLDVTKNIQLEELWIDNNPLKSIDLSKNTLLTRLMCGNNQLTSLDLSKNTALTSVNCNGTPLTSIDIGKNSKLSGIALNDTQLSANALNKLFEQLPPNDTQSRKGIGIANCPGTAECNIGIAKDKNWIVEP